MFKISDFSNLSRISIRMLRFYDKKGILHPSIIKENGYRYYEAKQLITTSHIQYLRYLGFSTVKFRVFYMFIKMVKKLENILVFN